MALLASMAWFPRSIACAKDPPPREELLAALKRLWDGLESLECQVEDFPIGPDGQRDHPKGYSRTTFALASGGRRSLRGEAVTPDGIRVFNNMREDGHRTYTINPFPGHPDTINVLAIANQSDRHEDSPSAMITPLWMLTPAGKPLHFHLQEARSHLEPGANPGDVTLVKPFGSGEMRCNLSAEHDWLSSRCSLLNDRNVFEVTRFEQDNGRWFPKEGIQTIRDSEGERRYGFLVSNLRINRPVSADMFKPPELPKGAVVTDQTTGKDRIEGGTVARREVEDRYLMPANPPAEGGPPIVATPVPRRVPWGLLLGSLAVLALGAAIVLARRGHR